MAYVFVYNFMYVEDAPFLAVLEIEGGGKPFPLDCGAGEAKPIGLYDIKHGRLCVPLTLNPGEAKVIAINKAERDGLWAVKSDACEVRWRDGQLSIAAYEPGLYTTTLSDGRVVKTELAPPDEIAIPRWHLMVEDWNEGPKISVSEDRGLGYVTNEVYFETKKTQIDAGLIELAPWKDIKPVGPYVSGVGVYTATVNIPESWGPRLGAVLCIGSTNGNSAALYVNGRKAPAVDFDHPEVDISALIVPGANQLRVEVSSTLNNRLIQRGYFAKIPDIRKRMAGDPEGYIEGVTQDYGMTGQVALKFYEVKAI